MTPLRSEPGNAARRTWSASRAAYLVHSAAGLWFTILLTIVMASGTLAVFTPEIDRLVFPQLRSDPPTPEAEKINPGTLYDTVAAAYPGFGLTYIDTAAHDRYASATTTILLPDGKRTVAIDSYTGRIRGDVPPITVHGFISRMHAVLFQGLPGFYVVNFTGVLTLTAVISGLFASRKFWRGFVLKPRWERGGRILLGDMHRILSAWLLLFLLVIGITGTWYFYNFPLTHLGLVPELTGDQPAPPNLTESDLDELGPATPRPLSGAKIVETVLQTYPDLTVTGLMPPQNLNMPFVVYGHRQEYLYGKDPNAIYVNPFTGQIMGAALSHDLNLNQFIFQAMSQLHHGELIPPAWGHGARLAMKSLWFLCGTGATFLTVSGLMIYVRRTRQAAQGTFRETLWRWIKPWGGPMKGFKYVNVLIVVALTAGIFFPFRPHARPETSRQHFPEQPAGPFSVSLSLALNTDNAAASPRPNSKVRAFPHISAGRFADARDILVGVGEKGGSSHRLVRVKGSEKLAFAPLRLPDNLAGKELCVEIRQWDGSIHRAFWPLDVNDATNPS